MGHGTAWEWHSCFHRYNANGASAKLLQVAAKRQSGIGNSWGRRTGRHGHSFLTELRTAGYNIAFDDFDFTTQTRRVLDVANYVKICFNRLPRAEISEQLSFLKQSKVKAIITGIETFEALEIAKSLEFEYFSGPCFTKPKGKTSAEIATNRLRTMQLIMK